jgi:hypothetical protein
LLNMMGPFASGAVPTAKMMHGSTFPSLAMECEGPSDQSVASLTNGSHFPLTLTPYDKSRIIQICQLLCGMAAIGEIFRVLGGLALMESHGTSRQKPCSAFSGDSFWSCCDVVMPQGPLLRDELLLQVPHSTFLVSIHSYFDGTSFHWKFE